MSKYLPFLNTPEHIHRYVPELDAPHYVPPQEKERTETDIAKDALMLSEDLSDKGKDTTRRIMHSTFADGHVRLSENITATSDGAPHWTTQITLELTGAPKQKILINKKGGVYKMRGDSLESFYAFLDARRPADDLSGPNAELLLGLRTIFSADKRKTIGKFNDNPDPNEGFHIDVHELTERATTMRAFEGKIYSVSNPNGSATVIERLEEAAVMNSNGGVREINDALVPPPDYLRVQLVALDVYGDSDSSNSVERKLQASVTSQGAVIAGKKDTPQNEDDMLHLLRELQNIHSTEQLHEDPEVSIFMDDYEAHMTLKEPLQALLTISGEDIIERTAAVIIDNEDSNNYESLVISERTHDDASITHEVIWAIDDIVLLAAIVDADGHVVLLEKPPLSTDQNRNTTDTLGNTLSILYSLHEGDRSTAPELPGLFTQILEEEDTVVCKLREVSGQYNAKHILLRERQADQTEYTHNADGSESFIDEYDQNQEAAKPAASLNFYDGNPSDPLATNEYITILVDTDDMQDGARFMSFTSEMNPRHFDAPENYVEEVESSPWFFAPKRDQIARAVVALEAMTDKAVAAQVQELNTFLDGTSND